MERCDEPSMAPHKMSVIRARLSGFLEIFAMSMNSREITVTAWVDAVINSLGDGQAWSRTDLHIAILNHSEWRLSARVNSHQRGQTLRKTR
jgi:hypothetical protein